MAGITILASTEMLIFVGLFGTLVLVALGYAGFQLYKKVESESNAAWEKIAKDLFSRLDTGSSGTLLSNQLHSAVQMLVDEGIYSDCSKVHAEIDTMANNDPFLFPDFCDLCKVRIGMFGDTAQSYLSKAADLLDNKAQQKHVAETMHAAQNACTRDLINDLFQILDVDGSGGLDRHELQRVLEKLEERSVDQPEISNRLCKMCTDCDDDISLEAFEDALLTGMITHESTSDSHAIFRLQVNAVINGVQSLQYDHLVFAKFTAQTVLEEASAQLKQLTDSGADPITLESARVALDEAQSKVSIAADQLKQHTSRVTDERNDPHATDYLDDDHNKAKGDSSAGSATLNKYTAAAQAVAIIRAQTKGLMKISISNLQILGAFMSSLEVIWPAFVVSFSEAFSFLELDLVSMGSSCKKPNYYKSMLITLGTPIVSIIAVKLITYTLGTLEYLENCGEDKFSSILVQIIFLVYPSTSATSLKIFLCREINGVYYLTGDYSLQCYDDNWLPYGMIGVLGICIYAVGCPCFFYILLARNKHALFSSDGALKARIGFIYAKYELPFFYWEITEMLRKLLLTGALLFVAKGSTTQLCVGLAIAGIFLGLHIASAPFISPRDDSLQLASLAATALTLVFAVVLKSGEHSEYASYGVILVTNALYGYLLYLIFFQIIPAQWPSIAQLWGVPSSDEHLNPDEEVNAESELSDFDTSCGVLVGPSNSSSLSNAYNDTKMTTSASSVPASQSTTGTCDKGAICANFGAGSESDLDQQIHRLFSRYDLDGSGTINTFDELEQLCCNLNFHLQMAVDGKQIDTIISKLRTENPVVAWDLPTFSAWFKETFCTK